MQQIHKFSFLRLVLLIAVAILTFQSAAAVGIKLSASSTSIRIGDSFTVTASLDGISASSISIVRQNSNVSIGSPSSGNTRGFVGESPGTCDIVAKCTATDGTDYESRVTITIQKPTVSLDKTSTYLNSGGGQTYLYVTVGNINSSVTPSFTWTSSDTSVVVISSMGSATSNQKLISGSNPGTATVTVSYAGVSASCTVTVTKTYLSNSCTVSPSSATMYVGQTKQFSKTSTCGTAATWSSTSESVATVSSSGLVTAKAAGTTTIKAYVSGGSNYYSATGTSSVTVKNYTISLDKTSATIYTGSISNTTQLTATTDPAGSTVTWKSSNTNVATVSSSGLVTSVGAGTATITATANGVSATCAITVSKPSITLSATSATLKIGETKQLTATTVPAGATVTWSSEYESSATVTSSGLVTAVYAPGTTITATANGASATCEIEIPFPFVSFTPDKITMYEGETSKLNLKIDNIAPGAELDRSNWWWSSDADSVVEVEDGNVTAKSVGKATITLTIPGYVATCEIEVLPPMISLSPDGTQTLKIGETLQLTATTGPANSPVTWTSSNGNIATVSDTGLVTAKNSGSTTITATANGLKASCRVTVSQPTITISPEKVTMYVGDKHKITPTAGNVAVGTTLTYTWSSDDLAIAQVESDGVVTAYTPGTATISVTSNGVRAYCEIEVLDLTISVSPSSHTLKLGETQQLTATTEPVARTITWSSSDANIATVSESGLVTAIGPGNATITARFGDVDPDIAAMLGSTVTATCEVTVSAPVITLSPAKVTMYIGDTQTIIPTVENVGANASLTYSWTSDDPTVATVDANGNLTALSAGTATIILRAGGVSASCFVTVMGPSAMASAKSVVTFTLGTACPIEVNLINIPEDAVVTWKSSDENVVTVSAADEAALAIFRAPGVDIKRKAAAMVTAVGPGSATITAECNGERAETHISVIDQDDVFTLPSVDPDDPETKTVQVGIGKTMDAKTLMNVKWASSDPAIAEVNDEGIVTGVAEGNALITATIGNLSSSFLAIVSDKGIVTDIREVETIDGDLREENGDIELYDLNGLKVNAANAQPGIYIVRKGGKTYKIYVK